MKVNLLEHLPDKTFIYLEDKQRNVLFDWYEGTLTSLGKKLNLSLKNISRYRNGTRGIPLKLFFKFLDLSNKNLFLFQDKVTVKVGKRGNPLKIGPFLSITPEWIYISELIRGDGSLVRGTHDSYRLNLTNTDIGLIKHTEKFFLNLGIESSNISIYPAFANPHIKQLYIHSEIISYFFNSFFKIRFGRKEKMGFPDFILKNRDFSINAVKGIFDAEGNIMSYKTKFKGFNRGRVMIVSFDEKYLEKIKLILNKFNIHPWIWKEKRDKYKDFYRLVINYGEGIKKFAKLIKPLHKKRNEKLKLLVSTYTTSRIHSKDLVLRILKLLLNKNMRRKELLGYSKLSDNNFGKLLGRLVKENLIYVVNKLVTNKGCWFVYGITKEGKDYLKLYAEDFS